MKFIVIIPFLLSAGGTLGAIPDLAIHTLPSGTRYAEGLMRGKDGVGLYTYAALPKAGVKLPVAVTRNPYIRNSDRSDNTNRVDRSRLTWRGGLLSAPSERAGQPLARAEPQNRP